MAVRGTVIEDYIPVPGLSVVSHVLAAGLAGPAFYFWLGLFMRATATEAGAEAP